MSHTVLYCTVLYDRVIASMSMLYYTLISFLPFKPEKGRHCSSNLQLLTSQPRGRINISFKPSKYLQRVSRPFNAAIHLLVRTNISLYLARMVATKKSYLDEKMPLTYIPEIRGPPIHPNVNSPFEVVRKIF